ncbi:ribosome biogenesis GTP-binding protein YihA/YsxC [Myxococcota bacterium]|nr:ribosome biogenesis GTP-binding protein YihA/YsxC [Myxococcota bacterium]
MKVLRAEFLTSAASPQGFPPATAPEVAFLGRSNVGKSSLINRLANRKQLARTSSTPGKTRLISWFQVVGSAQEIHFVDFPGYGYAKVAKSERKSWKPLVESYLAGREALRVAVLLQDLRREIGEDEALLIEWLNEHHVPVVLALTKVDKLKTMRRAARIRELRKQTGLPADCIVATSAQKGLGVRELWACLDRWVSEP